MFDGIPMSVPHTGQAQEYRLLGLGLRLHRSHPMLDIDTVGDLAAVAAAFPGLRTSALARQLALTPAEVAS